MSLVYTWLPADKPNAQVNYLHIANAFGSYLVTHHNEKVFDAISSWWCKPLGHSHPLVINSIKKQLDLFDHHIPAKAWNNMIESLSNKLVNIFSEMDKVMYASDGSSAIEIAMKLSYETRILEKEPERYKYIALSGAYHGETIFTLGVCGISSYKAKYKNLLADNHFIKNIPYTTGKHDPIWHECSFDYSYWNKFFSNIAHTATALIIEPIVQGAAGMKIISRDFLIKVISLARSYDLHIIADEIMVGLGRLGCYSVTKEILGLEPDIACFAKNLTAGSIPMSAVVINKSISEIYRRHEQIFTHSHTHSCNALAAAVANSYLDYLNSSNLFHQVNLAEAKLKYLMESLKDKFKFIGQVRSIGTIAALEFTLPAIIRNKVFEIAIEEKIYIRLIGNILYVMPPLYNIHADLEILELKLFNLCEKINNYRSSY